MKNFLNKIKTYIATHKVISIIVLIVILIIGYWGYKKITNTSGETRYVTSVVKKGTIISSITGTGQVSASSQVDLKAKTSGDVVYIGVKNGQEVSSGTLIAQIDSEDAKKSLRDVELNLENAKISLEKLKLQNSDTNMNADLRKAYDDGFTIVSDALAKDLPDIIPGIESILALENISYNNVRISGKTAIAYRDDADSLYYKAKDSFQKSRKSFRILDRNSSNTEIETIIKETYDTVKLTSDALKSSKNLVDYLAEDTDRASEFLTTQNTLSGYINTINTHLSSLLSIETSIRNNKDSFSTNDLDLRSSELAVKQKENALEDAKDKLEDYYIRAPFSGTIATIDIKKSDSVSTSTIIATLITKKQIAEISLNEVDMAQIKIGQKANLTFDAVSDLMISGEVVEIDSIGTEDQGVVTYNLKISFDTEDDRIKSGMSVSASIVLDTKKDVIGVPNGAIKSKNGSSYVEMFDIPLPQQTDGLIGVVSKISPKKVSVKVGISNDTQTEIISGLKEGDEIVTRIILPTSTTATTTSSGMFGSSGGNKSGGGMGVPH